MRCRELEPNRAAIDWGDFDAIFDHALQMWPKTIELSTAKNADGGRNGFNAFTFEDTIGYPYFQRADHKHIVRHMLWAMFCALPRDLDGPFSVSELNRNFVREKFEDSVKSDVDCNDVDAEEVLYYRNNMTPS